jgi:hypothetical protein
MVGEGFEKAKGAFCNPQIFIPAGYGWPVVEKTQESRHYILHKHTHMYIHIYNYCIFKNSGQRTLFVGGRVR